MEPEGIHQTGDCSTANRITTPSVRSLPSMRKLKRALRLFVALTLIGLVFVMYRASFAASLAGLRSFQFPYLLLAGALMVFDWVASGARIHVFTSRIQPGVSYRACVRANLANIFLGGMTPSQTGGGPAQVYVLYKEGMPLLDAVVVSFLGGFLGTAMFLLLAGLFATVFFDPVSVDPRLGYAIRASIAVFGAVVLLAVIGLVDPRPLQRGVRWLCARVPPLGRRLERRGGDVAVVNLTERYHLMMRYFLSRGKRALISGFVLTCFIYLNKFAIAWVVLKGLGVDARFWEVMYAQLVLFLFFYFAPSPGAAGFAEISAPAVMRSIIPPGYEGAFVLLWRLFTLFLGLVVGALITVRTIYRERVSEPGSAIDISNTTR